MATKAVVVWMLKVLNKFIRVQQFATLHSYESVGLSVLLLSAFASLLFGLLISLYGQHWHYYQLITVDTYQFIAG